MANITAKEVAELREMTGCGMMDCKRALVQAEGNKDEAVKILREMGLAKSAKKAGRIAAEGVVKAKVVGLTTFGAFATVIPGIDGLIHISQIADRHIAKPQDVLSVGEEVQAKITEIDFEKHRVSLSIRALIEPEEKEEDAEDEAEEVSTEDTLVYSDEAGINLIADEEAEEEPVEVAEEAVTETATEE